MKISTWETDRVPAHHPRAVVSAIQCLMAAFVLLGLSAGCSDDDGEATPEPDASVLKRYGTACASDAECQTGLCTDKVCSITCTKTTDCPQVGGKSFDCGEVTTGKLACYPRRWDSKAGKNCSADGKCEGAAKCTGLSGDADRYCAVTCTEDRDCPPQYRCVATLTGTTKETQKYCMKRQFCHPCTMDEQCPGYLAKCLKDKAGSGFCSQPCTPAASAPDGGTSDAKPTTGTCPTYATCAAEGSAYYCKHRSGFCSRGFKNEGAQCEPCIVHGWSPTNVSKDPAYTITEDGQCKASHFCVLYDQYYGESACLKTCKADADCNTATELCVAYESSLGSGTKVCRPWEYYVYGGKTYQIPGACVFK